MTLKNNSNLLKRITKASSDPKLIEEVFALAKESYQNVPWLSGENYIDHATRTALILFEMGIDQKTIAATFLYNVLNTEDPHEQKIKLQEIEKKFGKDIAMLAQKASELNKIYYSIAIDIKEKKLSTEEKIENIRKMFFAIAGDIRVIMIKLAARIDGMNNLKKLPETMQTTYATETLRIFAPIANRLGLGEIKTSLEDLSFVYLFPKQYTWLQENIKEKYEERQKYLKKCIPIVKKIFKHEKIHFLDINYRVKSYWSTYQKLQKRNMDFEKIHDLVALRVIVNDIPSCYKALGIIHKYYKPISEEINDYIAAPKLNGYKSLHTTVFLEENRISEIQIRTEQMHQEALYGVCAHWSYKEKINLLQDEGKFNWTKEIPEFWKTFKINFFENQIFAFTPMGDVLVLPKNSTAVDFAYAVHSEVGNHCEQAKIDGKIIPLSQPLKNGDVVEIILNRKRKPSQDWLRFVKTDLARSNIKKSNSGISIAGSIFAIPSFIKKKIFGITEKAKKSRQEKSQIKKEQPSQIYLAGQKGMLVNVAKCCSPKPGDLARAYLTKHRAAVLHKVSCQNLQKLTQKFPEKIIDASWE